MTGRLRKTYFAENRSSKVMGGVFGLTGVIGFVATGQIAWLLAGGVMSAAFFASALINRAPATESDDASG